jgi:hypothetical protein
VVGKRPIPVQSDFQIQVVMDETRLFASMYHNDQAKYWSRKISNSGLRERGLSEFFENAKGEEFLAYFE